MEGQEAQGQVQVLRSSLISKVKSDIFGFLKRGFLNLGFLAIMFLNPGFLYIEFLKVGFLHPLTKMHEACKIENWFLEN